MSDPHGAAMPRQLDISALLANPKIGAILHTGQPSVTMLGVGDVLFGVKPPAGPWPSTEASSHVVVLF